MLCILVLLALLAIAAYGAVWLANNPETIALTWQGREYSTTLAVGVVGFLAAAIALAVIFSVVQFLIGLPSRIRRDSRARQQTNGFRALSRGIVAIGAGDVAAARRHAAQADKLLGREPLTLLLQAQTAQASGDRDAAEAAFRRMTDEPETRLLGLRGLFMEARRRGDADEAGSLAAEAARIAPAASWASEAVLEGQSAAGDWRGATAAIERRTSLGLIDRATSRRQRAVLGTADALARESGDPEGALAAAQDALKLAPDLVPAAALAGRLLSRRGDFRRAAKVVETAWAAGPHPELAAAYLNLRPGDSAMDRLGRAETLARLSSWSAESRLAIGRAAIEAREFARARETLRPLVEERPTARVCLMMADLERHEGHAGAAREWLGRAARAPRDKAWIADGLVSDRWAPVSPVTGRLDAFRWETPPELLGNTGEAEDFARLAEAIPPEPANIAEPEPEPAPSPSTPAPRPASELEVGAQSPSSEPVSGEHRSKPSAGPLPEGSRRDGPEPQAGTAPALERIAEPVAPDPPRRVAANGAAPRSDLPAREPEAVVFPVPHAPDDPGFEAEPKGSRYRLRS